MVLLDHKRWRHVLQVTVTVAAAAVEQLVSGRRHLQVRRQVLHARDAIAAHQRLQVDLLGNLLPLVLLAGHQELLQHLYIVFQELSERQRGVGIGLWLYELWRLRLLLLLLCVLGLLRRLRLQLWLILLVWLLLLLLIEVAGVMCVLERLLLLRVLGIHGGVRGGDVGLKMDHGEWAKTVRRWSGCHETVESACRRFFALVVSACFKSIAA